MLKNSLFIVVVMLMLPGGLHAQIWDIETKLVAGDRDADQGFGSVVARTDDLAVVSALYEDKDENGQNPIGGAGAVYIFKKQSGGQWIQVQKIVASDRMPADHFGVSCTILGTTIIIGAEENDYDAVGDSLLDKAGAVFVFEKQNGDKWVRTQKLVAPDRYPQSYFGCAVDAAGNYLVVGARADRHDAEGKGALSNCGSAYVFKKGQDSLWVFDKKLTPITRRFAENFGCAVAIYENRLIIGAYRDGVSVTYPNRGAAYIFELDRDQVWMPIQKITPNVRTEEKFGWCVDLNKDILIVGAYEYSTGSTQVYSQIGAAYAFQKDNTTGEWKETAKFLKSQPAQNDHFAYSISLHNSYLVIGARRTNVSRGSVYMFRRKITGEWEALQSYESGKAEPGDYFGSSVSLFNGSILVGAPGEDHDLNEQNLLDASGSAFFLDAKSPVQIENEQLVDLALYPNPSEGSFYVNGITADEVVSVCIIDSRGIQVYKHDHVNEMRIEVPLSRGVYQVIIYRDGQILGLSKLVIFHP